MSLIIYENSAVCYFELHYILGLEKEMYLFPVDLREDRIIWTLRVSHPFALQ